MKCKYSVKYYNKIKKLKMVVSWLKSTLCYSENDERLNSFPHRQPKLGVRFIDFVRLSLCTSQLKPPPPRYRGRVGDLTYSLVKKTSPEAEIEIKCPNAWGKKFKTIQHLLWKEISNVLLWVCEMCIFVTGTMLIKDTFCSTI